MSWTQVHQTLLLTRRERWALAWRMISGWQLHLRINVQGPEGSTVFWDEAVLAAEKEER